MLSQFRLRLHGSWDIPAGEGRDPVPKTVSKQCHCPLFMPPTHHVPPFPESGSQVLPTNLHSIYLLMVKIPVRGENISISNQW